MTAIRMTLLTIAALTLLGIWLSGFNNIHWVLYLPPAMLIFAAISGICPGVIIWSKLGFQNQALSCALPGAKTETQ